MFERTTSTAHPSLPTSFPLSGVNVLSGGMRIHGFSWQWIELRRSKVYPGNRWVHAPLWHHLAEYSKQSSYNPYDYKNNSNPTCPVFHDVSNNTQTNVPTMLLQLTYAPDQQSIVSIARHRWHWLALTFPRPESIWQPLGFYVSEHPKPLSSTTDCPEAHRCSIPGLAEIPQNTIFHLIWSIPKHCQEHIQAHGGHTLIYITSYFMKIVCLFNKFLLFFSPSFFFFKPWFLVWFWVRPSVSWWFWFLLTIVT